MRLQRPAFTKRFLTVGLAVGVPVVVAAAVAVPQLASAARTHSPTTTTMTNWWTTFYGWTDNSPPGPQIFTTQCHTPGGQHITAANYSGEAGTYKDPVVVAWPPQESGSYCQIGYVPDLKKYVEHADLCNPCGGQNSKHWDIWMGGNSGSTGGAQHKALLACENKWTTHTTVLLSPPTTEPVDTTPLFTPPTTCHGGSGDGGGGGGS